MKGKRVLKVTSGGLLYALSCLLPTGMLFRLVKLLRRGHIRLTRANAPLLLRKAVDHCIYSLRPSTVQGTLDGLKFTIRLNDPCHYDLVLGAHEPVIAEWLHQFVRPGMTVVDVGANVGFYTLMLARLVGESGKVIAVEADPETCKLLRKNVEENFFRWVDVVSGAAHDTCGRVQIGRATASSGYSGLYYWDPAEWIEVSAFTVDSLVDPLGVKRVEVVKIDVEGAEAGVLRGMRRLLSEDRPLILLELHGQYADAALDELKKAGYAYDHLTAQHIVARAV
jgi:FkbM family methyltransferase